MTPGRETAIVVLVAVVLIVASAAYGLLAADRPQIESVNSEWGTVTSERTEVETRVVVDNPRLLRVSDAAANVSYAVRLNDIEVASERENRVRVAGKRSDVTVSTWLNNDEIPAWWATHVNRNETTTVEVDPDVTVERAGVRLPAERWTRTRTVRTDLLEPLRTDQRQEFEAYGRTLFVVDETDARWGTATADRTPITASATVTNPTPIPVPITEIRYTVRLNDVVVGQGVAGRQTVLAPDNTRTIEADAEIDNSRLDEWWVTHLRNDETSELTVEFEATLEYAGVQRTVPLEFISYDRTFHTDMLGTEEAGANGSSKFGAGSPLDTDAESPERVRSVVDVRDSRAAQSRRVSSRSGPSTTYP